MKNKLNNFLLVMFFFGFLSCDRPDCINKNLVFENNLPHSKEYKDELVKQLNKIDQSKLRYWLQKYDEQNGNESIYFNVQGDELCAIIHLTINHCDGLENVRERKGIGRRGAEFTNLKYEIVKDSNSTKFVYNTFDRIID